MRSPTPIGGGNPGVRTEFGRDAAAADWIDRIAVGAEDFRRPKRSLSTPINCLNRNWRPAP